MSVPTRLVYLRKKPLIGPFCKLFLKILGIEIPDQVKIGKNFKLVHSGFGVVIHPKTVIGDNVSIYHGVTLGRADAYLPVAQSQFEGFIVEDGVMIGAGAVVLCKKGILTLGKESVIGANCVLLSSTERGSIWAGNPAKKVGERPFSPEKSQATSIL